VLRGSVRDFRVAAALAVTVPFALSLAASSANVADVVGLAFAVAASSFCPLLLLGIWWRRLTDVGATAGLLTGGGLATLAVSATVAGVDRDGWAGALLAQPAAWTVPIAFAVMVVVSLLTPHRVAAGVARTMVRLHAPETVELQDRARSVR
jgi:Na+(H+)/acetate symporter ActP